MVFRDSHIDILGSRLRYRVAGPTALSAETPARTLLFLHGAGGADSALPFLAPFAIDAQVLVPDLPGFGDSPDPPWLDNIHDAAYACLEFMEALDLHNVDLLGASLGGWIAMELAVRDRHRLRSLTLLGASGIRPGDIPTGDLFMWSPEERTRQLIADPQLAARLLDAPQTAGQQDVALRNFFTTAKLAWEPRFFDPHLEKWLTRLRLPVHVIWGDGDRLFPLAYGAKLAALIPGARLSVIERCGHLPQLEQPERLAALLRSSLEAA